MIDKSHFSHSICPDLHSPYPLSNSFTTQSSPAVNFYDQHLLTEKLKFDKSTANKELEKKVNRISSKKEVKENKESKNNISASQRRSPFLNSETLLGDISFLNQFKAKVITQEKETSSSKEVVGRYSLLDRDLKTVDTASHVITELWKLPAEKSLNSLMGKMESWEDDLVIGQKLDVISDLQGQISKPIVKTGNP